MSSLRTRALAMGVAAVMCGVIAGPAAASTNVVIEVQTQARIFRHDPTVKGLDHVHLKTRKQVAALIPKYRKLERRFRSAAKAIAGSKANTAAQRLGKKQWVTGARTFANGLHQFDVGLTQLLNRHSTKARHTIGAADRKLQHGNKLIAAGNHTLGLR